MEIGSRLEKQHPDFLLHSIFFVNTIRDLLLKLLEITFSFFLFFFLKNTRYYHAQCFLELLLFNVAFQDSFISLPFKKMAKHPKQVEYCFYLNFCLFLD